MLVDYGTVGTDYPNGGGSGHVFSSNPGATVMGRSNYLGMGGYYAPSQYPQFADRLGRLPDALPRVDQCEQPTLCRG